MWPASPHRAEETSGLCLWTPPAQPFLTSHAGGSHLQSVGYLLSSYFNVKIKSVEILSLECVGYVLYFICSLGPSDLGSEWPGPARRWDTMIKPLPHWRPRFQVLMLPSEPHALL